MSLAKKIITSTLSLSASNFITRFLSFFSVLIIVRGLSLYEYGLLTLAMAITGPIAALSGMGLDSVFVSDTSRCLGEKKYPEAKRLVVGFVRNKIIITLFLLVCGWFLKSALESRYGTIVSVYFFWLAIWVVAQSFRATTDLLAQIYERFVLISLSNIVETAVKLLAVLIVWKTLGLSVITVLFVYIISKSASFLFSVFPVAASLRNFWGIASERQSVLWRIIKRHGKWEIVRNILSNVTGNLRPWFIKFLLNTESVAIFSLSQTVFSAISQSLPLKNVLFPLVTKKINNKAISALIIQKANKYSVFFYLFVMVLFFLFGEYVITLFFPKYLASVFLIKLMLFVLLVTAVSSGQGILLYGLREQKFLLFSDFIGIFSRLALLPLWLIYFGLNGAVFEMVSASLIIAVFFENYLRKKFQIVTWRWKNLFVFDYYDRWLLRKVSEKIKRFLPKRAIIS